METSAIAWKRVILTKNWQSRFWIDVRLYRYYPWVYTWYVVPTSMQQCIHRWGCCHAICSVKMQHMYIHVWTVCGQWLYLLWAVTVRYYIYCWRGRDLNTSVLVLRLHLSKIPTVYNMARHYHHQQEEKALRVSTWYNGLLQTMKLQKYIF